MDLSRVDFDRELCQDLWGVRSESWLSSTRMTMLLLDEFCTTLSFRS